jgi:hypothetical protein
MVKKLYADDADFLADIRGFLDLGGENPRSHPRTISGTMNDGT